MQNQKPPLTTCTWKDDLLVIPSAVLETWGGHPTFGVEMANWRGSCRWLHSNKGLKRNASDSGKPTPASIKKQREEEATAEAKPLKGEPGEEEEGDKTPPMAEIALSVDGLMMHLFPGNKIRTDIPCIQKNKIYSYVCCLSVAFNQSTIKFVVSVERSQPPAQEPKAWKSHVCDMHWLFLIRVPLLSGCHSIG